MVRHARHAGQSQASIARKRVGNSQDTSSGPGSDVTGNVTMAQLAEPAVAMSSAVAALEAGLGYFFAAASVTNVSSIVGPIDATAAAGMRLSLA